MRLLRLLSVVTLALSMGLIGADAKNLRGDNGPAETPPASYKGKQYVDSRGCVYIRAGYSGNVTWVPRVTRSRKLVCGTTSVVKSKTRTAKAPQVVRKTTSRVPANAKIVSRKVKVIPPQRTTTTRIARKTVAGPRTQTRVVRRVAPQPQTRVARRTVVAPKVQTRVVRQQAAPRRATAQPRVVYRCSDASDFSSQFINKGARCGPQRTSPRNVVREEISPQSSNTYRGQLAGPKGVNRKIAEARLPLPKGHKKAWTDGRLNPLRGVGTSSGKAQMSLVWSNTVPRHLVDPATGKRATPAQKKVFGLF